MVDQTNPTQQFHTYQAPDATPMSERPQSAMAKWLGRAGVTPSMMEAVRKNVTGSNIGGRVEKAREYARLNPSKVLGGMAALVIGAGLLRNRNRNK